MSCERAPQSATKLSWGSKYLPVKHTFIHFDSTFDSNLDSSYDSPEPRRRVLSVPKTVPPCFRPASREMAPVTVPTFADHSYSPVPLFQNYTYSSLDLHHSDAQLFQENEMYHYPHTQDAYSYDHNGLPVQHSMDYSYMYSPMEHTSSQHSPLDCNVEGFQVYDDEADADHNDAAATDALSGDPANQGACTPQKNVTKTIKLSEFLPTPTAPGATALDMNSNTNNAMHWPEKRHSEENIQPSNVNHGGQREKSGRRHYEKQQNDQWEHRNSRRDSRRNSRHDSCDYREYHGSTAEYRREYPEHREGQREHREGHREYREQRDRFRERRDGGYCEQRDAYREHRKGQREAMPGRENREDREGREMKRERHRRNRQWGQ
eukprot:GEMP01017049.1.p1 GENE.GEMP01017049.1~~GEMP01017049.1.p1  ORF type:complete len:377 (+),score=65.39 GEMP01017049.1:132-1262(+)